MQNVATQSNVDIAPPSRQRRKLGRLASPPERFSNEPLQKPGFTRDVDPCGTNRETPSPPTGKLQSLATSAHPDRTVGPNPEHCVAMKRGKPSNSSGFAHLNRYSKRLRRVVRHTPRRYFYDKWNFLDVTTIALVFVAFVFRMIELATERSSDLFIAQFFMAATAPFLFSRVLFLSQVGSTLGPMTQV